MSGIVIDFERQRSFFFGGEAERSRVPVLRRINRLKLPGPWINWKERRRCFQELFPLKLLKVQNRFMSNQFLYTLNLIWTAVKGLFGIYNVQVLWILYYFVGEFYNYYTVLV